MGYRDGWSERASKVLAATDKARYRVLWWCRGIADGGLAGTSTGGLGVGWMVCTMIGVGVGGVGAIAIGVESGATEGMAVVVVVVVTGEVVMLGDAVF